MRYTIGKIQAGQCTSPLSSIQEFKSSSFIHWRNITILICKHVCMLGFFHVTYHFMQYLWLHSRRKAIIIDKLQIYKVYNSIIYISAFAITCFQGWFLNRGLTKAKPYPQPFFPYFLCVGCRCVVVFSDLDSICRGKNTLFVSRIFRRTIYTFTMVLTTFLQIHRVDSYQSNYLKSKVTTWSQTSSSSFHSFSLFVPHSQQVNYPIYKRGQNKLQPLKSTWNSHPCLHQIWI